MDGDATAFASVSMHWRDTIRFIQFPETLRPQFQALLETSWPPGIQAQKIWSAQDLEFKMRGTPFGVFDSQETVGARRLLRDIFDFLWARGWKLVESLGHSRGKGTKDTLIFCRQHIHTGDRLVPAPPPMDWLILAMSSSDKLRIIRDRPRGEPDNTESSIADELGGQLVPAIKAVLDGMCYFQGGQWTFDSYEFKLTGRPWAARDDEIGKSRVLLLQLLAALHRLGWRSYATVRCGTEGDDFKKPDTWFFVRPKD